MSLIIPLSLMNRHDRIDEDINTRTKAIARATPMAGIIVAAALLSGLLFFFSSNTQSVLAQQQNMTGTNATTTGGGGGEQPSGCNPTRTGGGQNATTGSTAAGASGGGGNQSSTSNVKIYIEQACMAAQNGDMQGVMMQLNLALNALGAGTRDNMTLTGSTTNSTTTY
jgi:hypothetical protein